MTTPDLITGMRKPCSGDSVSLAQPYCAIRTGNLEILEKASVLCTFARTTVRRRRLYGLPVSRWLRGPAITTLSHIHRVVGRLTKLGTSTT
jgi:hypothetical protein